MSNDELNQGFPTFQWSVFLKNGRDEQLVIRTNTWEEFLDARRKAQVILDKVAETTLSAHPPTAVQDDLTATCQIHHAPMIQKNWTSPEGEEKIFWSHYIQNVGYCNGKKITPLKRQ